MSERNIYLKTIPLEEAVQVVSSALDRERLIGTETLASNEVCGRVCAETITAKYSSPTFHSAAMDGIALSAEKTFMAREGEPVTLAEGDDFAWVNTGNPLPGWADAVVMIENIVSAVPGVEVGDNPAKIELETPVFPWRHVRRIGEDIVAGEMLFPRHHEFSAYDVGALLSAGIWEVQVYKRPKLVVIPTGDEVLDFTTKPEPMPGHVVESNSQVMAALAAKHGFVCERVPPVKDDVDSLTAAVVDALRSDAVGVIIGAGSSAGSKDFTRKVMENVGTVLVHGIAAMPGKPSLFGIASDEFGGKLLVGAPGYPVSTIVCFEEIIVPALLHLIRRFEDARPTVPAVVTKRTPSKPGMEEFVRVSVGRVRDRYVATPLGRGAGMITTMTKAQGIFRIPRDLEGVELGETVDVELLTPKPALDRVLTAVGSHDNTLDLLGDALQADAAGPYRLASTHTGSMGGLNAVKDGVCHTAGAHLFDPESGDYNFPFIEKYLPDTELVLVNLAVRVQGLMVRKGNPKNIQEICDLTRDDVSFINRQRGAGTRILFDHKLAEAGLSHKDIHGYATEEFTHMTVAVNVMTGAADAGMGILAAAKALKLDFVPLAKERYDLIIPADLVDDPKIAAMLRIIRSQGFQERIAALGGYETNLSGQVMEPGRGLEG